MTNKESAGDFGERKLVELIIKKSEIFQTKYFDKKSLKSHIGDDAGVIAVGNKYLILSSDMLIEKHHFPKEMTYHQRGFKAVTVNLSDIAGMGAYPIGILISLAIPKNLNINKFNNLLDGILEACSFYNTPLIGGDTNEGNELIISGTGIGLSDDENIMMQYGFKNKDLIAISGEIGLSAIGFEILNKDSEKTKKRLIENGVSSEFIDKTITKILSPRAKVEEGTLLKKSQAVTSATDITDGLSTELHQIHNSSVKHDNKSLGFIIYEDKIPHINTIKKIATLLKKDHLDLTFNFGEDFELLFTIDPNKINEFKEHFKDKEYHIIGKVNQTNKIQLSTANKKIKRIDLKGYEHFK
ncbi:MAG: thiamine-phosphate kinase [Methanobrevibacter sp.]|jgi:thiamine-monophosphate kinase|nr:thiamine-phosphate kinase [Candidatus Methanovirga aequatorialis]